MAKYTSRQIAAHLSEVYREEGRDPEVLQNFTNTLEERIPALRRSPDRTCYQDISSLLYCVRDLKGSCRDAGDNFGRGRHAEADRNLNRAASRLQEIGELITDIRQDHPEEYKKTCSEFVSQWREIRFDKGEKILGSYSEQEPEPAEAPDKLPERVAPKPAGPVL